MSIARAVLTGMYEAESAYLQAGGVGTADFSVLTPYFAHDVELHQAQSLPYGGVWLGHAGLQRFFTAMSATWDRFDMADQEFLAADDARAVVLTNVQARSRATGNLCRFPILQTVEIADGRIGKIRPFYWDTAAINRAGTEHP